MHCIPLHTVLTLPPKEEAVEGRKRVTASVDSLAPQFRHDPSIEPPYKNAQISETAMHREVLRIYSSARPETRQMYNLGRDLDGAEEENWVIRWMLWHVFRYRDSRNKSRRPRSPSESSGDLPSDRALYQDRIAHGPIDAVQGYGYSQSLNSTQIGAGKSGPLMPVAAFFCLA